MGATYIRSVLEEGKLAGCNHINCGRVQPKIGIVLYYSSRVCRNRYFYTTHSIVCSFHNRSIAYSEEGSRIQAIWSCGLCTS